MLSSVHLKALHDGVGETEARGGEGTYPTPSLLPWLRAHLPCCKAPSQRGARLQASAHGPRTGGAGWGSRGCGRSSRNGSCPSPADPASRACWCSAACSPARSSDPAAAAGNRPGKGQRGKLSPKLLSTGPLGVPGHPGEGPLQKSSAPGIPEFSYQQLLVFGLEVARVFLVTEKKQGKS